MRCWTVALIVLTMGMAGCGSSAATSTQTQTKALNHLHSIAILPQDPNTLYMGGHYRLYQSSDGGKHWKTLSKQMMLSLTLDPAHPQIMYAVSLQHGLVQSKDAGKHWASTTHRIPKGLVTGVLFDPRIHALFAWGGGLYESVDGGRHWKHTLRGRSLTSVAGGPGASVFAATGNGLYVSRDGGKTWTLAPTVGYQPIIQVVSSGTTAYAVTAVGLMKSPDAGTHWKILPKAPLGVEFVGVSPTKPTQIYGEVGGAGFLVSSNGGATWHKADAGIRDRNFQGSTVQVSPTSPEIAYTGSWGLHVYATHDGGRHWQRTATILG